MAIGRRQAACLTCPDCFLLSQPGAFSQEETEVRIDELLMLQAQRRLVTQ